jgi:hypothetical protein
LDNVTFIKNEVIEVIGTDFIQGGGEDLAVGQQPPSGWVEPSMSYFYGYKTDGIFQGNQKKWLHQLLMH